MKSLFLSLQTFIAAAMYALFASLTRYMNRQGMLLCAYTFPEGSSFQFSQTFAAAKTITALTNANPAAATSAAHGYVDNDEVLLLSGWEDVNESVVRVNQTSTDAFETLGLVTTDTNFFPAGSGVGTAQKISGWVTIPQVLTIATSGGDPRFTTISPLAKRNSINVPTGFNAQSITLTLGHDSSDSDYQSMLIISRALSKVAFKMVLSGGAVSYGYGYMAVSEMPSLNVGQANTVTASFSLLGRSISYDT